MKFIYYKYFIEPDFVTTYKLLIIKGSTYIWKLSFEYIIKRKSKDWDVIYKIHIITYINKYLGLKQMSTKL